MDEFPSIEQCIKSIKDLGCNISIQSPSLVADLLTAIVAFLGYLDRDRKYMQSKISQPFPTNNEIPALSAIFEDSALFAVFLSMLSSKPKNGNDFSAIPLRKGHTGGFSQIVMPEFKSNTNHQVSSMGSTSEVSKSRKRSLSTSSATSVEHSPKKILLDPSRSSFSSEQRIIAEDANFSVLASVIFQTAFLYLEHWPAIFAQLYAEDSFGPRIWVDDERCAGFVSIISSVLKGENNQSVNNLDKANAFHKGFESYLQNAESLLSNRKSYERLIQAASNDNQYDSDSEQQDQDNSRSKLTSSSMEKADNHVISMKTDDNFSSPAEEQLEEEELMASLADPMKLTATKEKQYKISSESYMHNLTTSNYTMNWWKTDTVENFNHSDRYIGTNKEQAQKLISMALKARLNEKAKQNSSLLTSLEAFLMIPHVRSLVADHLERWLLSPALSGLARTLFSSLVSSIKIVDPLLPEDANALNSLLAMSLKQHQSRIHLENVINLVQRIPTIAVTNQIISYSMNETLQTVDEENAQNDIRDDNTFDLLKAIFNIVPIRVTHGALACAIVSTLHKWENEESFLEDYRVVQLCIFLNKVVLLLGDRYDGVTLIDEMLSDNYQDDLSMSRRSLSRVVFYAILWMVSSNLLESYHENERRLQSKLFMQKLLQVKKVILRWYLRSFTLGGEVNSVLHRSKEPIPPDFDSILIRETHENHYGDRMEVLLCLMFVLKANAPIFQRFTDQTDKTKAEEYSKRLCVCIAHGRLVDDELLNIILTFSNDKKRHISGSNALNIIEHMFSACSNDYGASLLIRDEKIVWTLFELSKRHYQTTSKMEVTKIACPGLWWRAMTIALVICGRSTHIAEVMWCACPTLQMLMKMAITNRFNFPTVDCDELQAYDMELYEHNARKAEYEVVQTLFLPEEHKKERNEPESSDASIISPKGIRCSARQKERQMKRLNIELQKKRELKAAEEQRIKHKLKEARKSVILFDPRVGARKPPQTAMKMLLHVCSAFQLSAGFIKCLKPDFVLRTIGNTTRNGIERAHNWLIPIISVYPSVIDRLPSSASCFLLLRAYGKRRDDSEELLKLSSPLLDHIKRSISGDLGDDAVKRAVDLLFYDLKSNDSERRSCARRLLNEALVDVVVSQREVQTIFSSDYQWLVSLTNLKNRSLVLECAIPCISEALLLERDKTLRAYIFALKLYDDEGLYPSHMNSFTFQLMSIMHRRSISMCSAMERYDDLRSLCTHILYNELCKTPVKTFDHLENESKITIFFPSTESTIKTILSLSSLKAAIVLFSTWRPSGNCDTNAEMETLISFLLPCKEENDDHRGATGARFAGSDNFVLTFKDWIRMVKSPCESISNLAVQSAPDHLLIQFLFSSGLSSEVVSTILKRLDYFFKKSGSSYEYFAKYTSQNAIDKWTIGHRMNRNEVIRILYGRLKAYLSNANLEPNSFCYWLYEENRCNDISGRIKISDNKSIPYMNDAKYNFEVWAIFYDNNDYHRDKDIIVETRSISTVNSFNEGFDTTEAIVALAHSNDVFYLRSLIQSLQAPHIDSQLVVNLLKKFAKAKENKDLLFSAILQVMSLLDIENMNIDLFETIFLISPNTSSQMQQISQIILRHLIRTSPDKVVQECQSWIIKYLVEGKIPPESYGAVITCFLLRRITPLSHSNVDGILHMNIDMNSVAPLALLALSHGSRTWPESSIYFPRSTMECSEWVLFLLMLSGHDKDCLLIVSQTVIDYKSPSKRWDQSVLPGILLHIFAINPEKMNLENGIIRDNLIRSVVELHQFWRNFSVPRLDGQIQYAIQLMDIHTLQTQTHIVLDFVKCFPLVAIKHISELEDILHRDATASLKTNTDKGRQFVEYPFLSAIIPESNDTPLKVFITHWGARFFEPLWIAILDILLAFPNELLFKIGHLFGLQEILYIYVKLFKTQLDIQHINGREEINKTLHHRIRNKFMTILDRYKCVNKDGLNEWIESTSDGYKIGTLLVDVGCNPILPL